MLEACFRRFFYSGLDQHRIKKEAFKNRINVLTNRIEKQMSDYDMLLNGVDTMIWLNYKPDVQGKSNQAVLDFFGVSANDLEGKNLRELLSPEEAEFCIQTNKEIFRTGEARTTYEQVTRYDGQKRLLKINKRPKKNGVQYIVCSAEDVTEKKDITEELWSKILMLETKLNQACPEEKGNMIYEQFKGNETILVVEDEEVVLDVLSQVLQQHGYIIVKAVSSKEAIEYLSINPTPKIDMIISDFYLDNLTGQQLVNIAREKVSGIKHLIISGVPLSHVIEIPEKHFLNKPFRFEDLSQRVREILDT